MWEILFRLSSFIGGEHSFPALNLSLHMQGHDLQKDNLAFRILSLVTCDPLEMSPWDFVEVCSIRFHPFAILKDFMHYYINLDLVLALELGMLRHCLTHDIAIHDKYHCSGALKYFICYIYIWSVRFMCLFGSCRKYSWTVGVKAFIKTLYGNIYLQWSILIFIFHRTLWRSIHHATNSPRIILFLTNFNTCLSSPFLRTFSEVIF